MPMRQGPQSLENANSLDAAMLKDGLSPRGAGGADQRDFLQQLSGAAFHAADLLGGSPCVLKRPGWRLTCTAIGFIR